MSRCYEMNLFVQGHAKGKSNAIVEAVRDLGYDVLDVEHDDLESASSSLRGGNTINFSIDAFNLNAGVTEEENAREVTEVVWKANEAFCNVQVGMRDLDAEIPRYSWGEEAHDEWLHSTDDGRSKI